MCSLGKRKGSCAARFRSGYWCFCDPGSEKTWKDNEERPFQQFADGGWDNLALRMINELLISKHPLFKCWNILQTGVLIGRTKGGGAGTHFKNEPENHLMLVQMTLACDHLCLFFFHKNSTDWNLHPRIQSGRSHGVSPPRATSLCSRWCGHVLTELKKEQEKEPLQPTQQELMVKASQEAGFSKTIRYLPLLQDKTALQY